MIYTEVAVAFEDRPRLEQALQTAGIGRINVPWLAAWLAARAFRQYRARGGGRAVPLPDFFIGAHAAAAGLTLLTRDPQRVRAYFPEVRLIAPARR